MAPSKFLLSLAFVFALHLIEARPPVKAAGRGVPSHPATNDSSDWNLGLEYNRYEKMGIIYFYDVTSVAPALKYL